MEETTVWAIAAVVAAIVLTSLVVAISIVSSNSYVQQRRTSVACIQAGGEWVVMGGARQCMHVGEVAK